MINENDINLYLFEYGSVYNVSLYFFLISFGINAKKISRGRCLLSIKSTKSILVRLQSKIVNNFSNKYTAFKAFIEIFSTIYNILYVRNNFVRNV